jgi:FkbM family methyltransferase
MSSPFEVDLRTSGERRQWVAEFEKSSTRRAILGTNQWAESVAAHLDIEYFIDDFRSEKEFLGRPVVPVSLASPDVMTLSTALLRPMTARKVLQSTVRSHLDYYSFLRFASIPALPIHFLNDRDIWAPESASRLTAVRDRLFDAESLNVWDRIVRLRRDLDIEAMVVFSDREESQYFESFVRLESGQTFLDVGGFDGFTTQSAINKYGPEVKCHIFEPNAQMIPILSSRFSLFPNVRVHDFGLSSSSGNIQFEVNGSSSRTGVGTTNVPVRSLDELELSSADLVKVDIEGGEEAFLQGASQTIQRLQPQLVIACYHRNEQLVSIFERVMPLMPDSRVYVRHFTEGFPETDIFFVPPRFW